MNGRKHEGSFIPCGDSMEKMEEIKAGELGDGILESVSGGTNVPDNGDTMYEDYAVPVGAIVVVE